ncbi:MAG: 5,6-dimethylbenzimidazole synthase [Candidatus Omnitrophica bacterium]|nr:5,6-dimethylbenzimidazole synthase [Candidatus Omnitrophota bacterium]
MQLTFEEREAFYKVIFSRRDVREGFLPDPIPEEALGRILEAAHHAGSVGFMQPWNFILIDSAGIKKKVKEIFTRENQKAAENYSGDRGRLYRSFKLEGILESPLNIAVTCDPGRGGEHVLGRNTIRETDLFSTCCAIQNLWLAARAEGIGIGWVSIINPGEVKALLGIPESISLVSYLCAGYVAEFAAQPMLETKGWASRIPLENVVFRNGWKQ